MGKVYKMTEDQIANLITAKKNKVSEVQNNSTKKKYRITEDQLKKIFSELGTNKISEMDNYNYPMGSDTPDAPWNQNDDNIKQGESVNGDYIGVFTAQGEFLLKNNYTIH